MTLRREREVIKVEGLTVSNGLDASVFCRSSQYTTHPDSGHFRQPAPGFVQHRLTAIGDRAVTRSCSDETVQWIGRFTPFQSRSGTNGTRPGQRSACSGAMGRWVDFLQL